MPHRSPTVVILENVALDPDGGLGHVMNEIRSWLDGCKIQPVKFRTRPSEAGGVAVEIKFRTEDEAQLFDQAFA